MKVNLYKTIQTSFTLGWVLSVVLLCLNQGFNIVAIIQMEIILIIMLITLIPFVKYISNL